MLLQRSVCDSAPVSVARTAAVRVSELSGDCYVSGKRVTGDGAGPLQPRSAPGAERGKEGGMKWERFQLSCAHFVAEKPARKMSCSLPRWLQTFPRCLVKKNSNSARRKHLKQKRLFLSKRYPAELTYASSLPLCNLPTIHNTIKCTEEQCVYTFPLGVQQSSYHLDTARGNFLCGSADAVFRRRSGPVIESLRSC